MEALDILEKRIDTLTRMLGPMAETPSAGSSNESTPITENVVDSLLSAQTLLNAASAGREQISKAIDRAPELEQYLEPDFLEKNQQVLSKEVYLNAVAPDLHVQFEHLNLVKQLEPTLGAEYFRNIPGECTEKLKQVAEDNTEFAQQSELIEESLILAMKRYGDIQSGIMASLDVMNKRLEKIEDKLQHKKREEMEKELPPPPDQAPAVTVKQEPKE